MQLPDFRSVNGRGCRPTQPFPVLPCMGQASPSSLTQDLPFECGEDGQQAGHRPTRGRSQVQRLGHQRKRPFDNRLVASQNP